MYKLFYFSLHLTKFKFSANTFHMKIYRLYVDMHLNVPISNACSIYKIAARNYLGNLDIKLRMQRDVYLKARVGKATC